MDMPIYEYQCASCRKKTEFIQSFSDPHPVKCPSCGGALKKLLSSPTAHFKGSGFYATDYGKSGGKPEDSAKGKEEDSSKGKERDGGAAKSEGGAEPKGDSAGESAKDSGDSSKEKKDSRDSSKEKSDSASSAAKEAQAKTSNAPSKKNTRTK
jgi:putative FmdB family regulatory protein